MWSWITTQSVASREHVHVGMYYGFIAGGPGPKWAKDCSRCTCSKKNPKAASFGGPSSLGAQ